jgi:hypothetical protein
MEHLDSAGLAACQKSPMPLRRTRRAAVRFRHGLSAKFCDSIEWF